MRIPPRFNLSDTSHQLQITEKFKYYRGCAFGVRSASFVGQVAISEKTLDRLSLVCEALKRLTGENLALPLDASELEVAQTIARTIGAIQRHSGIFVSHTFYAKVASKGIISLGLPAPKPKLVIQVLKVVFSLLDTETSSALTSSLDHRLEILVQELAAQADQRINRFMLHQAADAMKIPVLNLSPGFDIVGTGCHSRWFNSTITDKTASIGVSLARDKFITASLLRAVGLPGAEHELVQDLVQAHAAANRLGFPLVIKPNNLDRGLGVFADLRTLAELDTAFAAAYQQSSTLLVERWMPGYTHRLTVFDGRVVWVSKRIAGGVTGDGRQTIAELVNEHAQSKEGQRRALRPGNILLVLDDEALSLLARGGYDASYVPPAGQYIRLRYKDNVSAGGTNIHCNIDDIHPDNLQLAQDAARLLHLDFAGIDLIISDITRSWQDIGGLICEVNAQPQLRAGGNVSVYQSIFQSMFKNGACVSANVVVVPDDLATRPDFVQKVCTSAPDSLVSSLSGLWQAGKRLTNTFKNSHEAAIAALTRIDCRSVQVILSVSDLLEFGLPTFAVNYLQFAGFENASPADSQNLLAAKALIEPFLTTTGVR